MSDITFFGSRGFESTINHVGMYPDSMTYVKPNDFTSTDWNYVDTVMLRPSGIPTFIAGLSVVDSLRERRPDNARRLILPYIPGARQDRSNPTGDAGFMLKTVARILNAYEFDQVLVADPHSSVATDLIDNIVEFPLYKIYSELPGDTYDAVIAPDKGAKLRATIASATLRKPVVQASKIRDVSTGKLSGFDVNVEPGKHYIVIDDICDGGGTFVGLGEKIHEQEATADLYVTHGIFSKPMDQLNKFYENIFTTNSRDFRNAPNVNTIDILSQMRSFND